MLSIAVAESVFWILSFPTSELLYYVATGEWIDVFTQEQRYELQVTSCSLQAPSCKPHVHTGHFRLNVKSLHELPIASYP